MTNNPGAAGGALIDVKGRLAGLLGKELRSSTSNLWLNYAIPIGELQPIVDQIIAGKFRPLAREEGKKKPKQHHTLAALGIQLAGRPFEDELVLRAGHAYERATEWSRRRPPEKAAARAG